MPKRILTAVMLLCFLTAVVSAQEAGVTQKTNFAVVNLKPGSGVTGGECELITDRLRTEMFNTGKVNVMERSEMQEILKEQGFQHSGVCTDDACLVEMGQMLGVQTLVIGSLGKLGSMFMINVRAIDVQTAKIVKVVSVDIKGDIEELVDHLPNIARQLVSSKDSLAPAAVPEEEVTPEPPQDSAADTVREEVVVIEKPVEQKKDEAKSVGINERAEKNRNRSGIGIHFEVYGQVRHIVDGEFSDSIILLVPVDGEEYYDRFGKDVYTDYFPATKFMLNFKIKAGPYFNVFVGPTFMFAHEEYSRSGYLDYEWVERDLNIYYYVPSVHTGFAFVKRWFPLKLNIGINLDFCMPITHYTYVLEGDYPYVDEYATDFDFWTILGFKGGIEIMAGKHVGFNLDILFNWLRYSTEFDFDEFDFGLASEDSLDQEILFPALGVGFGINFYY